MPFYGGWTSSEAILLDLCPTCLHELPVIISYSDGEGGVAGIGAAVWSGRSPTPLAVYAEVPEHVRQGWSVRVNGRFNDIFLVEAMGPLLLLLTFPKLFRDSMWLHFIDNSAAEASLIRGASSTDCGDHIVGLTWKLIMERRLWAYFDRVESKANPVDGLSRGVFSGPWQSVLVKPSPSAKLDAFAETCGR